MTEALYRMGLGTDSHAFEKKSSQKTLTLGGVAFPGEPALEGDSDGDVILHALFNAIHSALGESGLGAFFKKSDFQTQSSSEPIIRKAMETLEKSPYRVGNVSIALECQRPRVGPKEMEIRKNLARLLGVGIQEVGLTATSGDGLTSFGEGKGIYCHAQVLLYKE